MANSRKHRSGIPRRKFLQLSAVTVGAAGAANAPGTGAAELARNDRPSHGPGKHAYNGDYSGAHLNRVAFPLGGIGAGMICLEGTGALSHVSLRNKPEVFNEPLTFAAIAIKGANKTARVL